MTYSFVHLVTFKHGIKLSSSMKIINVYKNVLQHFRDFLARLNGNCEQGGRERPSRRRKRADPDFLATLSQAAESDRWARWTEVHYRILSRSQVSSFERATLKGSASRCRMPVEGRDGIKGDAEEEKVCYQLGPFCRVAFHAFVRFSCIYFVCERVLHILMIVAQSRIRAGQ